MIQLIPEKYHRPLVSAIANGNIDNIRNIIEQNGLEVNIYSNHSFSPITMDVLTSFGIKNENDRLKILQFFLDRGADPNLQTRHSLFYLRQFHIFQKFPYYFFTLRSQIFNLKPPLQF